MTRSTTIDYRQFALVSFAFACAFVFLFAPITPAVAGTLNTAGAGGTGGTEFQGFFDWIIGVATGYGGRSIAIVGGLIGLAIGAAKASAMIGLIGVAIAIFGVVGPAVADAIFTTAII